MSYVQSNQNLKCFFNVKQRAQLSPHGNANSAGCTCARIPVPCYVRAVAELSFLPFGVIPVICSILSVSITDISAHTTDTQAVLWEHVAEARGIFTTSDVCHVGNTPSLGKAKIKIMERLRQDVDAIYGSPYFRGACSDLSEHNIVICV